MRVLLTFLVACSVVLTSCTGPSDAVVEDQSALFEEPLGDYELPMDRILAATGGSSSEQLYTMAEDAVAKCMKEQGFDYFPTTIDAAVDVESLPDDELLAYAQQHAYGLAEALPDQPTFFEVAASGVLPASAGFEVAELTRNELYVASLSEGQRDAYYVALDGHDPDPATGEESTDDIGCTGEAVKAVDALAADLVEPIPAWLDDATAQIDAALAAAQVEYQHADNAWSACMNAAGFVEFSYRIEAPESVRHEYLNLVTSAPDANAPVAPGEIAALEQLEFAVAEADADCYVSVYRPALYDIEVAAQMQVLTEMGILRSS